MTGEYGAGQVWEYMEQTPGMRDYAELRQPSVDCLRLTRPGKGFDDWMGVRLQPKEWEEPGTEWLLTGLQLKEGRYRRRQDLEDAARVSVWGLQGDERQ